MYKYWNMRKTSNAKALSFGASFEMSCYLKALLLPRVGAHDWLDFVDVKKQDSTTCISIVNTMVPRYCADLVDISVTEIH
jgi:hypothetical protein